MMNNRTMSLLALFSLGALVAMLLTACMSQSRSGRVYTQEQARTTHSVYYGTVLRVSEVTIEGTESGAGTLAGGAMGAALGSGAGSGSGKTMAVVGGAIVGALVGSAMEKGIKTVPGVELEVELDNGELLLVVQEQDAVYNVGDRVRLVRDAYGTARIRQ
ncbi:MAG: hypothetical protein RQ723_03130 [Desulfuromonadales bacterium]|nr:hypothetical protein [Desulfuromonadales bacterium]